MHTSTFMAFGLDTESGLMWLKRKNTSIIVNQVQDFLSNTYNTGLLCGTAGNVKTIWVQTWPLVLECTFFCTQALA